uniref:Band 7 domain-containing protein n=1 Tax=Corethron hystrix TaxID=216773 RepID=A0A7S1BVF6_9STRA|mmetsp:Transcript_40964/g.96172  ORF Transcript_40964/g.96172 Transcript_40964/m.96172 type:complete len:464 (+) Transcript_40964:142-1533(+)
MISLVPRADGKCIARSTRALSSVMMRKDVSYGNHWQNENHLIYGATSVQAHQRSYTLDSSQGGGSRGGGGSRDPLSAFFRTFNPVTNDNTDVYRWPVRNTNTLINICPQGYRIVLERFGKLHEIKEPGIFLAIPVVDSIAYVVDMRERALEIPPQAAITKDNVSVEVSGNVFLQFTDAAGAAYGARNPLASTMTFAQSVMRSAIGEMELDEILHGRAQLNAIIKGTLQEAAVAWGIDIRRYEITEVTPDTEIRAAMDKQAAAERTRRELVLQAEGQKRRAELTSEGVKITLQNESEGMLIKIRNEADANRTRVLYEAEGESEAIRMKADAYAKAISSVAAGLQKEGGMEAARLALAKEYVTMYGDMGSKSNTIMMNDRPADVNSLISQVALSLGAVSKSLKGGEEVNVEITDVEKAGGKKLDIEEASELAEKILDEVGVANPSKKDTPPSFMDTINSLEHKNT